MKPHDKFMEEVAEASSLPAQTKKALGPESDEDRAMYNESQSPKSQTGHGVGQPLPCESNNGVPTQLKDALYTTDETEAKN